jgi:hypothetical protein
MYTLIPPSQTKVNIIIIIIRGVVYPVEFVEFISTLTAALATYDSSQKGDLDQYTYWDVSNNARYLLLMLHLFSLLMPFWLIHFFRLFEPYFLKSSKHHQ